MSKQVCEATTGTWPHKCGRPAKYIYARGVYAVALCGLHSKGKLKLFPERMTLIEPKPKVKP